MKYVVNQRGRAIRVEDKTLEKVLFQGFTQITEAQFKEKQYFPEYDRGPKNTTQTATIYPQTKEKTIKERTSFKTVMV